MSSESGARDVVLVHGGFVDGSGWQGVHDALTADGYRVAIVQNPTLSLEDDAAVTRRSCRPGTASCSWTGTNSTPRSPPTCPPIWPRSWPTPRSPGA